MKPGDLPVCKGEELCSVAADQAGQAVSVLCRLSWQCSHLFDG